MKEQVSKKGSVKSLLREKIDEAPDGPGVYIMFDASGAILYIGKAKSLRKRVKSYADSSRGDAKTRVLLRQVRDMNFLVTDNEVEALILENTLIKKWKPKYNISLKDDKTYPFLRLSVTEDYPTLTIVRRPLDDKAKYFGPFVTAGAMRRTLRMLQKVFPLRRCRKTLPKTIRRPCLNFQMGRCLGPCAGMVGKSEYRQLVKGVTLFLQGRGKELAAELDKKMRKLADEQRFEEAAVLRDRIVAIGSTLEKQKIHISGKGDMDIIGTANLAGKRAIAVLHSSHGKVIGARTFSIDEKSYYGSEDEALGEFIRAFYSEASAIPPEVLLPRRPADADTLTDWMKRIRGGRFTLLVPQVGRLRSLVALASRNALRVLEGGKTSKELGEARLKELCRVLGGKKVDSLAAVDVSNITGKDAVASLVWWQSGTFEKKSFRRFRIRSKDTSDDTAMMAEAIERMVRRVKRGEWREPDVLMLDGGRGHLSAVRSVLERESWRPRMVLAIAKPQGDRVSDAVYKDGERLPIKLDGDSPALRLLQEIRDEAHRCAVQYHRLLSRQRGRKSELDDVPGIGSTRKQILLRKFGSLARLRRASREEVLSTPGLPRNVAAELYKRLRG